MRPRWRTLFPLLILIILVAGLYGLHRSGIFTVRTVQCSADGDACPDYIQAELETHIGRSLFFTDFYVIGERITQLAPSYAHVEITKVFSDTVVFSFSKANPAYLFVDQSGQPWIIDEAGFVIATGSATQTLPTINAAQTLTYLPSLRDRLSPELHQDLLTTLSTTSALDLDEGTLTLISEREASLALPKKRLALFTLTEAPVQLAKLSYLLKRFDFEALKEPIAEIDLRYGQVILRGSTTPAQLQ